MTDEARQARLAFIGAGSFATTSLYPNIHKVPQIDLVAVCDLDREKAERAARNFGARAVYTDAEKMLDEQQPDGVFVIGPAPMQYQVAPIVLRRGIPVYVEKPSANTSAQARELAELAEANGVWGQCGFMKRFAYVYRMASDIMTRPEFGEVNMVTIHSRPGPLPTDLGIDPARRAMLISQLCHIFDLTLPRRRCRGGERTHREVTSTQFAYLVNLRFRSGAIGSARYEWSGDQDRLPDIREGEDRRLRVAHYL